MSRFKKESNIQAEILRYLKSLENLYFFKTITCNKKGVPDIIICYKGRFVSIECKTKFGKLSSLQEFNREEIYKANGNYLLARSLEEVKDYFDKLSKVEL